MKRKAIFPVVLSALSFLFLVPHFGFTQDRYSKFEISTNVGQFYPSWKASYANNFNPPFTPGEYMSWARQTLNYEGKKSWGFGGNLSFFPVPNFGLQVMGHYFATNITGQNSLYEIYLKYTSRQPPSYEPRSFVYEDAMKWPETAGNLKQIVLSLNAVLRIWLGSGMSFSLSGGGSYFHFDGEAASMGFTKFWLGGHSVLYSTTHQLMCKLAPETKIGYNGGAELGVALFQNFNIYSEFRYFFCPKTSLKMDIKENATIAPDMPLIKQYLPLRELKITPSFTTIQIGLKYKF